MTVDVFPVRPPTMRKVISPGTADGTTLAHHTTDSDHSENGKRMEGYRLVVFSMRSLSGARTSPVRLIPGYSERVWAALLFPGS